MEDMDMAEQATSFADQIKTGKFSTLIGFANNPGEIMGQTPHAITSDVEIDSPGEMFSNVRVCAHYWTDMSSLSELLDFAIRNPDVQREKGVAIVWVDDDGKYWNAFLGTDKNGGRLLSISKDIEDTPWANSSNFLRRIM